jgi:hypothetical protein
MGTLNQITALDFPTYIKPRNFAKPQCERQWLTPPIVAGYEWGLV